MNAHAPLPLSEQFRLAAEEYVRLDAAANILEESKTAVLAKRMAELGEMPVSKAEMSVKASDDWHTYIRTMCDARAAASLAKVQVEVLRMRHSEMISEEANHRAGARL